jgi:hypothetical protein
MNDYGINDFVHIFSQRSKKNQKKKFVSGRAWSGAKVFAVFLYTSKINSEQIKKYYKTQRA